MPNAAETAVGEWRTVRQGDCISSIAHECGLFWQTVWDHPNNHDLRELRKDPNILLEGDRVFVPDIRRRVESRPTDQRHRFRKKSAPARIRLRLMVNRKPRANTRYTLIIDGQVFTGTTDNEGGIEQYIPPNAQSGKLILTEDGISQIQDLNLGYMDPITEASGVRLRLINLGYDCGDGSDASAPKMRRALSDFQSDRGLPGTGELDDQTRSAIQQAHGS